MLACWSVNGGVGTTVVVAGLAVASSSLRAVEPLVVDLGGDQPLLFGASPTDGPGLAGWLRAGPDVPDDALRRLEADLAPGISVVPRGEGELDRAGASRLIAQLAVDERALLVDVGVVRPGLSQAVVEAADRSFLVIRACPLALARTADLPARPTGVIVVRDHRRVVTWQQVADACDAPVVAELDVDPAVAAAVDAGLSRRPLPRRFVRVLETLL